jgi:hypothetical protein
MAAFITAAVWTSDPFLLLFSTRHGFYGNKDDDDEDYDIHTLLGMEHTPKQFTK